jgi:catalase
MPLSTDEKALSLGRDLLRGLDNVFGVHPGFRPAHSKGAMFTGEFTPSPEAHSFTRAPHAHQTSTPVTVRFSDGAGIPTVADNDPQLASPRGCAIRFHLGEHAHTDIVSHSHDGFPARTPEEFVEFLHAIAASDPSKPHPNDVEKFVGSHPKALEYVSAPKPIPTSFAREKFFAVNAFKFTGPNGASHYARYRILPVAGTEYLSDQDAAAKSPNFLFEELSGRLGKGPVKFLIVVQIAEEGDTVDDATIHWPDERRLMELGEIALDTEVAGDVEEKRRIIFDPIPRVDGIEPSADPLFTARADVYLMSGRRRREVGAK